MNAMGNAYERTKMKNKLKANIYAPNNSWRNKRAVLDHNALKSKLAVISVIF